MKRWGLIVMVAACGGLDNLGPTPTEYTEPVKPTRPPLPPAPDCVPALEVCDDIDNDCDGDVDEATGDAVPFCYDGELSDLSSGVCHAGVWACIGGDRSACINQRLPDVENCDGIDNDCDGLIDEGLYPDHDVVIAVDTSASMRGSGRAALVRAAVILFLQQHDLPSFRFALIDLAWDDPTSAGYLVLSDFADAGTIIDAVRDIVVSNSASEPTIDALHAVCTNGLNLSFRAGSMHLYLGFADEMPQTITSLQPLDVRAICDAAGVEVYHWGHFQYEWFGTRYDFTGDIAQQVRESAACQ